MESRAYAMLALVFLVLMTGGAAYLFYWLQAAEPEDRIFLIDSQYNVGDLHAHSEITYKGLLIGHVKSVGFHPEDPDKVRVRLGIQRGVPVTESMYAELGTRGLTGTNYLALKKEPEANDVPLKTSKTTPAHIPLRPSGGQSLMAAAEEVTSQVKRLTRGLNQLAGEDNQRRVKRLLTQAERSLAHFEALERSLQPSVKALPQVLEEAQGVLGDSQHLLQRTRHLMATTEAQVKQAGQAASAIADLGGQGNRILRQSQRILLPDLEVTLGHLKRAAANLETLSRRLERRPQSIWLGPVKPPPGPGEPGFNPTAGSEAREAP